MTLVAMTGIEASTSRPANTTISLFLFIIIVLLVIFGYKDTN